MRPNFPDVGRVIFNGLGFRVLGLGFTFLVWNAELVGSRELHQYVWSLWIGFGLEWIGWDWIK